MDILIEHAPFPSVAKLRRRGNIKRNQIYSHLARATKCVWFMILAHPYRVFGPSSRSNSAAKDGEPASVPFPE